MNGITDTRGRRRKKKERTSEDGTRPMKRGGKNFALRVTVCMKGGKGR
jgi:hypothetical protein